MKTFKNMANLIHTKRKELKIPQTELGFKLGYNQKNGQFISNVERGACSLPPSKFNIASEVLGISRDQLIDAYLDDLRASLQ